MNKAFEARLRSDPKLQVKLDELQARREQVRDLKWQLDEAREAMQRQVLHLAQQGVPLVTLGEILGLSSQRMSSLIREVLDRIEAPVSAKSS